MTKKTVNTNVKIVKPNKKVATKPKPKPNKGGATWRPTYNGGLHNQLRKIKIQETLIEFKRLHWNRVRLVLSVLLVIVFCLQIACTVSSYWLKLHDVHHQGIWRVCTQTRNGIECFRYDFIPDYFKPIQAMMVIAIVLHICSFIYLGYMLKLKKAPAFILTVILALTAALIIISLGLFTDRNLKTVTASKMKFGWGYYVGWAAVFFTLISAAVAMIDERYRK